jgi:hypothetical protein
VQVWRVMRASATSRFKALRSQSLPLLGREATMATVMEQWRLAQQGAGRVALVSGEAGIGKSRLVLELARQAARGHATVLRFQCSPRHDSSMLHCTRSWSACSAPCGFTAPINSPSPGWSA